MAVEDFSTYTELDDNTRITVTASRVRWADLTAQEDAYVYKDKTVAYFSGDFTHILTVKVTAGDTDGRTYVWAITNTVNDMKGIDDASGSYLSVYLSGDTPPQIVIEECDGGSIGQDSYTIALNTPYYLKIVRDESIPDFGKIYCYIYSDSGRTTLLDTIFQSLKTSKKDYRYIFSCNTRNSGIGGRTCSGYAENLEFLAGSSSGGTPTVTTQSCTGVIAEKATGHGLIINSGTSAITQHGHCWGTSASPTTTLSTKTENGAAPNATRFTSNITGLVPGTAYYVRAYATNTTGTAYGGNQTIAGDVTTIGRRHWWVEKKSFHYFDEWGTERVLDGHTVGGY